MDSREKLFTAINTLKTNAKCIFSGTVVNETTYTTIEWEVDGSFTTTNPHAELSWSAVKTEMDKL